MKKKLFLAVALLLTCYFQLLTAFGQSPNGMSYQAVIRDASDNLITDTQIGMQISILQGSVSGTAVYVETQEPSTNANGLVSLEIGAGTVESGDFTTIDWANGPYFIKTETAVEAPLTSYTITGTSQLLSVPFAMHAKTAETVENITVDYADVSNTPDLSNFDQDVTDDFDGDYNNLTNTPDLSGYLTSEVDGDASNEIQDLELTGNILTITNNGTATAIDLSTYLDNTDTQLTDAEIATMGYIKSADDADADASNEIQDLELTGNILTITNNGTATAIDLSTYLDNTDTQLTDAEIATMGYIKSADDADADASNEIQDLELTGNILTITNNGTATAIDLSTYLDNTDTQLTDAEIATMGYIKSTDETDPVFTAWDKDYADITNTPTTITTAQANAIVANTAKNSYPAADATKLANIEAGAEVNVQADWNASSGDAQILNKPSIPAPADGSETKVTAGTNVTVTGSGTTASPYVVNASSSTTTYSVGDFAHGGIVFWVDDTGQHGLVCAKDNQSTGIRWHAGTDMYTMAKGDGPLSGEMNTAIIIANQAYGDGSAYAARICNELQITENGKTYGDWYLPSKEELNLMYQNRMTINATATANSGMALGSNYYWSSTENADNTAWLFSFSHGAPLNYTKGTTHWVRAVRAF